MLYSESQEQTVGGTDSRTATCMETAPIDADRYSRLVTGAPDSSTSRGATALQVVILDDFLPQQARHEIVSHLLARESEFLSSRVTLPVSTNGARDAGDPATNDGELRRSRVVQAPGQKLRSMFVPRLRRALVAAFGQTGDEEKPPSEEQRPMDLNRIEVQLTASGDGDFYGLHADGGPNRYSHRDISFVYFLSTDPSCFTGGELRLEGGRDGPDEQLIEPSDNRLVMFPSRRLHEIRPVEVPSGEFRHSRFTVNGWVSLWTRPGS